MNMQLTQKTRSPVFAEEAFVVDVQSFLHQLMLEKGMSQTDLAAAMGVSKSRVSQIFSDECKNFTIRLLARACFALGEEPRIACATSDAIDLAAQLKLQNKAIERSKDVLRHPTWSVKEPIGKCATGGADRSIENYSKTLVNAPIAVSNDGLEMVAA